jgi:propanediol dehydratase large subunit
LRLYVGVLRPLDTDALVETVRHLLAVAVAEAVARYKLSATAAALAAVTTSAGTAVKAAADAAAAAADHAPRMDYSLEEAGWQLSRSQRTIQYELDQGLLIGTHKGTSHRISHAELERQVRRDDGKPGTKKGKKKLPRIDP